MAGGLAAVLATFLGFGILLAFTPCVLPMIPILSGMLARSGGQLSAGRGFALSMVYVLAMASAYAAPGHRRGLVRAEPAGCVADAVGARRDERGVRGPRAVDVRPVRAPASQLLDQPRF